MADPQLLVNQGDELADLVAACIGHLEVKGAGHMQRFHMLHPVEGNVVITPAAAYGDADFIRILTFENPIVNRSDMFNNINRVHFPFSFK